MDETQSFIRDVLAPNENEEEEEEETAPEDQGMANDDNRRARIPKYPVMQQRVMYQDEQQRLEYDLIRQEQLGAALQRGAAKQAAKSSKEQKDNEGRANSLEALDDGFAAKMKKKGLSKFDRGEFVRWLVQSQYSDVLNLFENRAMSLDRTLKKVDVFTKGKFDPLFPGMPRLSLDGLMNVRLRKDVVKGRLTGEEALWTSLMANILFNKFCTFYGWSIQGLLVQRLGAVLRVKNYVGNIEGDIIEVIKDVTYSKPVLSGFNEHTVTASRAVVRRGGGGRNMSYAPPAKRAKKGKNPELAPYHDKSGPQFVPKGWCMYFHGLGSCSHGDTCRSKHTRWSAADEKAARASK